jgi:hypothetical protein
VTTQDGEAKTAQDWDLEVRAHLEFAWQLARRVTLGEEEQVWLADRLRAVERRMDDPRLYLAVIGEFSSGKSTFINALIGEDLLAVGAEPTTNVPAWIVAAERRQLRFKLAGDVQELTYRGQERRAPWPAGRALRRLRHRLDKVAGRSCDFTDLRSLLQLLTADQAVGAAVTELELGHPAPLLADGLVVIDTMGTNAGDARHVDVTQRILREEADAAVVVVPATFPVSDSLVTFLKAALDEELLWRCVFVVTWMDKIGVGEQARLLESVRGRVQRKLARPVATVLPAAPACALLASEGQPLDPVQRRWADQFPALVDALAANMRCQRVVAVSLTVLRLLDGALGMLQDRLTARATQLAEQQRALASLPIHDLGSLIEQQRHAGRLAVDGVLARLDGDFRSALSAAESSMRRGARAALGECGNKSTLNECVRTAIPQQVERDLAALQRRINALVSSAASEMSSRVLGEMDRAIAAQYEKLRQILPRAVARTGVQGAVGGVAVGGNLAGLQSAADAASNAEGLRVGAGLAAGAVIGTALLPGLGTLFGVVLGGIVGALFGPRTETVRAQYLDAVDSAISSVFDQVRPVTARSLAGFTANARAAVDVRCAANRAAYEPAVTAALRAHQDSVRAADEERRRTQRDMAEIRSRRETISAARTARAGMDTRALLRAARAMPDPERSEPATSD